MSARRNRDAGYTLLELLVVLVILGVGYAAVSTSFTGGNRSVDLNSALQQIAGDMRVLRSNAILSGEVLIFEILDNGQGYISNEKNVLLDQDLTLLANINNFPENQINFYPDGTSSDFKISLNSGDQSKFIASEWPTGRIMVSDELR